MVLPMKTYQEYENEQYEITGQSPESYYAEQAWKAALKAAADEFDKRGLYGAELLEHWASKD